MRSFFATLVLVLSASAFAGQPDAGVAPDQAKFTPGKEVKITDPESGACGYYVVYTPKNYKDDREWPAILCLHGKTGSPTTWPFKDATDGKDYIIIGYDYKTKDEPNPAIDMENIKKIRALVETKLKINSKLVLMGGFSLGGWSTSSFSHSYIDKLAGIAIMGAGGQPAAKIKGKPVFIGVGENDQFNKDAKAARDVYIAKGADVTFTEFPGLGHSADPNNKALKEWLLKVGPQNQMMASLALAKAADKAGKIGEAFNLYSATGKMSGGEEAAARAKAIGDEAEKKIADADALIKSKKYGDAAKILTQVAETYAGAPFAATATATIQKINTDPSILADIEQAKLDAKADALEAIALSAEKAKEYAKALTQYENYLTQFTKATRFTTVRAHVDELKSNPSIMKSATIQSAERDCKSWLATADSYIKNNMADSAKPYLQKILDKYGDTEWASAAKKRMAELKN
ncbi:MAG TPA: hypothetical protein VKX17_16510 [Planctomycetota bacterium]|nr:hypothetical protein [Planctomycetota bacterium]